MPIINKAIDYFIEQKPDIAKDLLFAIRQIVENLSDNKDIDDEKSINDKESIDVSKSIDVSICRMLFVITSFCETVKTTYSKHDGAEEIFFSDALENVTLTQLRNHLYHDFLIPEAIEQQLALKKELVEFLSVLLNQLGRGFQKVKKTFPESESLIALLKQLEDSLVKVATVEGFSENTFLRKIDNILLERREFNHLGGQNIFLQAHNIEEICLIFSKEIYAIKPFKKTVHLDISKQNDTLSNLIFGMNGYFSILNNLEKANGKFEQPLKIGELSERIKISVGDKLNTWAKEFLNSANDLTIIPKKMATALQKSREILSKLPEISSDFQNQRFSEISVFLSKSINESTNCVRNFGHTFKTKALMQIIETIQTEQNFLFKILSTHMDDESDQRLIQSYVDGLEECLSSIEVIQKEQLEAERDKDRKENYYHKNFQNALQALYKKKPKEYEKLIHYLTQAITIQPAWFMPVFLKKCIDLIMKSEDNNHRHDARKALLSEICFNHTRIKTFIKIFGKFVEDPSFINNDTTPCFGSEMYLVTSMNTCLKTIENIGLMSSDITIQRAIEYVRSELNMRNYREIETVKSPLELSFFEFISSHAGDIGIGLAISYFRHDTTAKTFKKRKENIKQLYAVYAAFKESTAYHSPENIDMVNATDLYKIRMEKTTLPTGSNQASKITDLCFDRFLLTYQLNMIVAQEALNTDMMDMSRDSSIGVSMTPKLGVS